MVAQFPDGTAIIWDPHIIDAMLCIVLALIGVIILLTLGGQEKRRPWH